MTRLSRDQRALGIGIILFFAVFVVSALLFIMLDPAMDQLEQTSLNQTSNQNATAAINERKQVWDNILFVPLLIGGVFIIARAAFESRRP